MLLHTKKIFLLSFVLLFLIIFPIQASVTLPWTTFKQIKELFYLSDSKQTIITQVSGNELHWRLKSSSFFPNIKSFEAKDTRDNTLGTLTLSAKSAVIALVFDEKEYVFFADEKGINSKTTAINDFKCEEYSETHSHAPNKAPRLRAPKGEYAGVTDNVIREYRLAVAVGYLAAKGMSVEPNVYFISIVDFLNSFYMRDLGVRFRPVLNDALFNLNEKIEQGKFSTGGRPLGAASIRVNGTPFINDIVGIENYDIGIVVAPNSERIGGQATLSGVYNQSTKAHCMASEGFISLAHEIGHLFGAQHTFLENMGNQTVKTNRLEPDKGTSVMSYSGNAASTRVFFNLGSILQINKVLVGTTEYYVNEADRPNPTTETRNLPKGIFTENLPPRINREAYQHTYNIPAATPFRFEIQASDPDKTDALTYQAQQFNYYTAGLLDYQLNSNPNLRKYAGIPLFELMLPKEDNAFYFQNRFFNTELTSQTPNVNYIADIFLMIYDHNVNKNAEEHKTMIDTMHVRVNASTKLKPFRLDYTPKNKTYTAGDQVTITWTVDEEVVPRTDKVRIRMSADLGQSYPYILVAETENDGQEVITLPYIPVSTIKYNAYPHPKPLDIAAGVFMVEHLNGICYAVSEIRPVEKIKTPTTTLSSTDDPNRYTRVLGGFTLSAGTRTENYFLSKNYPIIGQKELLKKQMNDLEIIPAPAKRQSYFALADARGNVLKVTDKNSKTELTETLTANEKYTLYGIVSTNSLAVLQSAYEGKTTAELTRPMYTAENADYITPSVQIQFTNSLKTNTSLNNFSAQDKTDEGKLYLQENRLVYKIYATQVETQRLSIYSTDGKLLYSSDFQIKNGYNTLSFDPVIFPKKGIYIAHIQGKNSIRKQKIVL